MTDYEYLPTYLPTNLPAEISRLVVLRSSHPPNDGYLPRCYCTSSDYYFLEGLPMPFKLHGLRTTHSTYYTRHKSDRDLSLFYSNATHFQMHSSHVFLKYQIKILLSKRGHPPK